jgi:hypothetical protein
MVYFLFANDSVKESRWLQYHARRLIPEFNRLD